MVVDKQTVMRIWHTFRLWMIPDSGKRAVYIRKHKLFHRVGKGCTIMERKIPLYPQMISLGDNVHLASKVSLVTHDAIHLCLNGLYMCEGGGIAFKEKIGCIEIGNNVFVGSNTTVLYDVKVGSNVIIGAGSVVNKDISDNSVAVGIPARVIGTFDEFVRKRMVANTYPDDLTPVNHEMMKRLEDWCWDDFHAKRG